mgnify:CR=1 FL=1
MVVFYVMDKMYLQVNVENCVFLLVLESVINKADRAFVELISIGFFRPKDLDLYFINKTCEKLNP